MLSYADLQRLNLIDLDTTIGWEQLNAYVGANNDDDFVQRCWAEASALVDAYIGSTSVPLNVINRACLEVGSELFHRRQAPNGIAQFATADGSPMRVARDPLVAAYPLLNRYVGGGFA